MGGWILDFVIRESSHFNIEFRSAEKTNSKYVKTNHPDVSSYIKVTQGHVLEDPDYPNIILKQTGDRISFDYNDYSKIRSIIPNNTPELIGTYRIKNTEDDFIRTYLGFEKMAKCEKIGFRTYS